MSGVASNGPSSASGPSAPTPPSARSESPRMSAIGFGIPLVAIWILLWGSLTPANVSSGIGVVALVLWIMPVRFTLRLPTFRPIPVLRLVASIVVDLFRANAVVSREVVTPDSSIRTGVVAVHLPLATDGMLTLVANVLSLTPGTMPLEVTREPPMIYVHVLHMHDVDRVRHDIQHLSGLAIRAFGTPEAVHRLDHPEPGDESDLPQLIDSATEGELP